jgi:hypothetical protein
MLTQERLKELFNYDPVTGFFTRLKRTSSNTIIGEKVGGNINGYLRVSIDNKFYLLHRLAFLYMEGEFPIEFVDHIDGCGSNN